MDSASVLLGITPGREAQGGDPVGNDDEALSGRLPGLPGKSQFQIIAHTITN